MVHMAATERLSSASSLPPLHITSLAVASSPLRALRALPPCLPPFPTRIPSAAPPYNTKGGTKGFETTTDHVWCVQYVAFYDALGAPGDVGTAGDIADESQASRWVSLPDLQRELAEEPELFLGDAFLELLPPDMAAVRELALQHSHAWADG